MMRPEAGGCENEGVPESCIVIVSPSLSKLFILLNELSDRAPLLLSSWSEIRVKPMFDVAQGRRVGEGSEEDESEEGITGDDEEHLYTLFVVSSLSSGLTPMLILIKGSSWTPP